MADDTPKHRLGPAAAPPDIAAAPSSDVAAARRVLLWSHQGSGLHYGGPGSSAYRLYRKWATLHPGEVRVELGHASPRQTRRELFAAEHDHTAGNGVVGQVRAVARGRRFVRDNALRFDVFHGVQGFHHTIVPAFEAQRRGLPACVKLASHQIDLADKPAFRHRVLGLVRRRRAMAAQLSAIICISRSIVDECLSYGFDAGRLAYIPDGADTDHFRPAPDGATKAALRQQLGLRDLTTISLCGGMVRRKRPDLLVEACGRLRAEGREVQILLVGPEQEPAYLRAMRERAAELNVVPLVHFAGFHEDVADFYAASDLFCLPSSGEGLPNALLEAMASGLPPIATQISGAIDVIEPGVLGAFVDADAGSVTSAIRDYLDAPDRLADEAARARRLILDGFSTRSAIARHRRLFDLVTRGQPAAGASEATPSPT